MNSRRAEINFISLHCYRHPHSQTQTQQIKIKICKTQNTKYLNMKFILSNFVDSKCIGFETYKQK